MVASLLGLAILALILVGAVKAVWALLPYIIGVLVLVAVLFYVLRGDYPPDEK